MINEMFEQTPLAGAEHGRRRTFSGPSQFGGGGPLRQGSFKEFTQDVQAAAAETYLITRLALTLLKFLGYNSHNFDGFPSGLPICCRPRVIITLSIYGVALDTITNKFDRFEFIVLSS